MSIRIPKKVILNYTHWVNLCLLILFLGVLPFFILALYCHPSADDFWLTNIAIEKGPWAAQQIIRQTWSGRYTAMFLGSINPLVFNSFTLYKCLPVLYLMGLLGGFYWLVREVSNHTLPRKTVLALGLTLLILYLHQMPTVAQTIYWMSGAVCYQTANILLLLLLAAWLRYRNRSISGIDKSILPLFISVLLFLMLGCNETSMGIMAFLTGMGWLFFTYHHRKINYFYTWLLLLTITSCCLVVFAPGNAQRSQEYPYQHDFFYAFIHALTVPINNSLNWLMHSPIIPLTILFIPFYCRWPQKHPIFQKLHPVITLFLFYGCLAAGYFIAYWSKHNHAPPRAQDVMYFIFLLGWFFNVMVLVNYCSGRYSSFQVRLPVHVITLLVSWTVLLLLFDKLSNIRTAYADVLSGTAARYNQEMNNRYAGLKNSTCLICPIKTAKNRPPTIFFEEVTPDSSWENTFYARYFGKKLLIISE